MTGRPVVVVGDIGVDVLVRPLGAVSAGGDTPSSVRIVAGGAGGNTAAWLAASGMRVALVGRVGDDEAGRTARSRLEQEGVVCRFVTDPERPTCTVVILVDGEERTMLPDRGAGAALSPADLDLEGAVAALGGGGRPHLHLSGFVLTDERSRPAGLAALEQAAALGWTRSVDPQAANHVSSVGGAAFLRWVRGVDLLLPNGSEAEALGGDAAMLAAVGAVAVSAGSEGARWLDDAQTCVVAARPVVGGDRAGCGDAFDAGVIGAWLAGASPEEALRRGVELGSRVAGRSGARP